MGGCKSTLYLLRTRTMVVVMVICNGSPFHCFTPSGLPYHDTYLQAGPHARTQPLPTYLQLTSEGRGGPDVKGDVRCKMMLGHLCGV